MADCNEMNLSSIGPRPWRMTVRAACDRCVVMQVFRFLLILFCSAAVAGPPPADKFTPGKGYGMERLEPVMPRPLYTTPPVMPEHEWKGVEPINTTLQRAREVELRAGCRLLSHGCKVTSSSPPQRGELEFITDGDRSGEDGHGVELPAGPQWVQIDLGEVREVHGLWVWRYHRMPVVFRGVKIELAEKEDGPWTTYWNTEPDASGKRSAPLHYETFSGFPFIPRTPPQARFVRLWSEGADQLAENHYVEVAVYGRNPGTLPRDYFRPMGTKKAKLEPERPKQLTTASPAPPPGWPGENIDFESWKRYRNVVIAEGCRLLSHHCPVKVSDPEILGDPQWITDGVRSSEDGNFVDMAPGKQWMLIDLGASREIHCVWLWLNHKIPWVSYKDVIVQITDQPDAPGAPGTVTVLNTDTDGSSGIGKGIDSGWVEDIHGRPITFPPVKGRYVKVWTNGRTSDDVNHFTEVAVYGKDITPEPPKRSSAVPESRPPSPDNLELVKKLREFIVKTSVETEPAQMMPYTGKVPRAANAPFQMVPIPGGEFLMGSVEGEEGRKPDEGPQVKVKIDPFWMGAHEVTWDTCAAFIFEVTPQPKDRKPGGSEGNQDWFDAITGPSDPYMDMTFGMGLQGRPVIGMTEHTALKYCQWLSAQTGHYYRLPTEAEWEYAARAGTRTRWFFGSDEQKLGDYAWYFDNSEVEGIGTTHPVGKKKPNPWGLYDIYGNVAEWTLDQHSADWYARLAEELERVNPFHQPTQRYPRVVRGGSWDDYAKDCRSAARCPSRSTWKAMDPASPKSLWYYTSAPFLGFRIVRPLKVPSAEEMHKIWNLGVIGAEW